MKEGISGEEALRVATGRSVMQPLLMGDISALEMEVALAVEWLSRERFSTLRWDVLRFVIFMVATTTDGTWLARGVSDGVH